MEIKVWVTILVVICLAQGLLLGWALAKIRTLLECERGLLECTLSALRTMKDGAEKLQKAQEGRRE